MRPSVHTCVQRSSVGRKQHTALMLSGFGRSWILFGLTLVILGGMYLFVINASAVRGNTIHDLETQISELEQQQDELRIRAAQLDAKFDTTDLVESGTFERVQVPYYIEGDHVIALGR